MLTISLDGDTERLLTQLATRENRRIEEVIADAIFTYVRGQSGGYRHYLQQAERLLDPRAPKDERAFLREQFAAASDQSSETSVQGGDIQSIRLRLLKRSVVPSG